MPQTNESLLHELVGAKVESVVFVMDYVQLNLWLPESSPRLTCYAWPLISTPGGVVCSYGELGYRDALCDLITNVVVATESSTESGLALHLQNGATLALRPTPDELERDEVAMLQLNDSAGTWEVWGRGDHPYETDS